MCLRTVQPALDRLLREQARGEQHARVRRVGARRDRGDQHVAVADRHVLAVRAPANLSGVGRLLHHLYDVAAARRPCRRCIDASLIAPAPSREHRRDDALAELRRGLGEAVLRRRLAEEIA